jgi:hypothetical protein
MAAVKTKAKVVRAKPKAKAAPARAKPARTAPKTPARVKRPDRLTVGAGAAKMVDLLVKAGDKGVTYDDLLAVTGWAECRPVFFAACEKAKVVLKTDKTVKPMRYVGAYKKGAGTIGG